MRFPSPRLDLGGGIGRTGDRADLEQIGPRDGAQDARAAPLDPLAIAGNPKARRQAPDQPAGMGGKEIPRPGRAAVDFGLDDKRRIAVAQGQVTRCP